MRKGVLVSTVVLLIFGMVALSYAEVPKLINYQGHLTDKGGNPLTGPFCITFTIYDAETGGSSLWTETQCGISVKNGLFSVLLGSVSEIPASVFPGADRWLGVAVQSDSEMEPRQQLVSVPYAQNADTVDGYEAADLVPSGVIVMWSGSIALIPTGWHLCDGTNGTPDLKDRFIVGAGSGYAVGDTGGEAMHTLTVAEMPAHTHTKGVNIGGAGNDGPWTYGCHVSDSNTGSTGGNQPHENRPPYYSLAYIMKL